MKKLLFVCSLLLASLASADTAFQTYYPPGYAWASKPTCAAAITGMEIRVTDVGGYNGSNYTGSHWYCDGAQARWVPVGGTVNLVMDMTTYTHTAGSTSETLLASYTIPAGLMRANSCLYFHAGFNATDGSNSKISRVEFGAAADTSGTTIHQVTHSNTNTDWAWSTRQICNKGATNSQETNAAATAAGGDGTHSVNTTAAIDTTAATYVNTTAEVATVAEFAAQRKMIIYLIY